MLNGPLQRRTETVPPLSSCKVATFDSDQSSSDRVSSDVEELHRRCGIYTRHTMVESILDEIGWTSDSDLSSARLLEPSCGDGAFIVAAGRRAYRWAREQGINSVSILGQMIVAYELHPLEALKAKVAVAAALAEEGCGIQLASDLAELWVRHADFLLSPEVEGSYSHVAGNPPYARWSRIPISLRNAYEAALGKGIARGDLFLPFLDRSIALLRSGGVLGFLCSDRWRFMAFAEVFRATRLGDVEIVRDESVEAGDVYQRPVGIYPSRLIMRKIERQVHGLVVHRRLPLVEKGFRVRVGPALGCTDAFVLEAEELNQVEDGIARPWLRASDVTDGCVHPSNRFLLCMHDETGRLRHPSSIPKTMRWLERFRDQLSSRSIVRVGGAAWYRPIDKVQASAWTLPKLLVPELAKIPRVAMDSSGSIPSHGVYAIFADRPDACLDDLLARLADGGLARALKGTRPMIKGGYVRCYKRFLEAMDV